MSFLNNKLKSYLPTKHSISQNKGLRFLQRWLLIENLWYINRRSVARACAIGLFVTWMPIPLHMAAAAAAAIFFQANIPISIALVWVINPLTMVPLYSLAYWVGTKLTGVMVQDFSIILSWDWLFTTFLQIWQPFLAGCLFLGIISSVTAYLATHYVWRYMVIRAWNKRKRNFNG